MAKSSGDSGGGSIGRYYNNNRRSPDFERFVTWKGTYGVTIVQISNSILLSVVTGNTLNDIIFKHLENNNIMFIEASWILIFTNSTFERNHNNITKLFILFIYFIIYLFFFHLFIYFCFVCLFVCLLFVLFCFVFFGLMAQRAIRGCTGIVWVYFWKYSQ